MTREPRPPRAVTPWGTWIRAQREARGMDQTQFATAFLGKASQQAKVSRWEHGGAPPDRGRDVAELARALSVDPRVAMVAAGFISAEEANTPIEQDSVDLLRSLAAVVLPPTE